MATISPREFATRDGRCCVIRVAEPADAETLLALERSVVAEGRWTITTAADPDETLEERERWVRRHRDDPRSLALVAEASGRAIGVADLKAGARRRINGSQTRGAGRARRGPIPSREWRNALGFRTL